MSDDQQKTNSDQETVIAGMLAMVSLIGAFIWFGFIHFAMALGSQGDGSASIEPRLYYTFGYAGSLYLGLVFVTCLPFIRGLAFIVLGVVSYIVLLFFAVYLIRQRGGILLLIPFLGVGVGWVKLFKAKDEM